MNEINILSVQFVSMADTTTTSSTCLGLDPVSVERDGV